MLSFAFSVGERKKKKAKEDRETLAIVFRLINDFGYKYAPRYAIAVVAMMIVAGATAFTAYLMKEVVDSVFVNQSKEALFWVAGAIVVAFFIKGIASYVSEVLVGTIGNRIVAHSQQRIFDHLLASDVNFIQARASSEIIARLTHCASAARNVLNMISLNFGRDLLTLCGLLATMIYLDPILTALALIGGPAAAIGSRRLVEKVQAAARSEANTTASIINSARELSQGIQIVKSFQLEPQLRKRMEGSIGGVERLSNRMLRVEASVNPLIDTLGGFAVALVVLYAGWRNLQYGDTPGQFFAFITALLMCADPARRLSRVHLKLVTAAIGVRMMYEILDTPAKERESDDLPELKIEKGAVKFDDVSFAYVKGKRVIRDLTLRAPAKKMTALVGLSGSGKSTLIALLQRLREPDSGRIVIDGQCIADFSRSSLRRQITFVGQDCFLFNGSVIDNIRAADETASTDACIAAAKIANAHEFIRELPDRYETEVGELGTRLSGGQRQRIALARAVLKDAKIILLDEPTSSLDSETESHIQSALDAIIKDRTTIIIAHRIPTIMRADLIHVLERGKVRESGTHKELIARGGIYSRLYHLQFGEPEVQARAG